MAAHWFTDLAAKSPSATTPRFTQVETQALTEILTFAQDPSNLGMELLICLDAAGTLEHGRSTGSGAAPFTEEMEAAITAANGVRLWHNHPSQQSLSQQDWLCAESSAAVEVLAVNVNGSIFVGRIVKRDARLCDLLQWLRKLSPDLEMHVDKLAKKRNFNTEYLVGLSSLTGHMLNIAFAKKMSVRYAFRLLGTDLLTITKADALSLTEDGIIFAEEAIQEWLDEQSTTADLDDDERSGP